MSYSNGANYSIEWQEVTRSSPCKICGKPGWCSATPDGVWAVCRRVDTGDGRHKIDQGGGDYWLYRTDSKSFGEGMGGTGHIGGDDDSDAIVSSVRDSKPELADPDTLHRVYQALLGGYSLSDEHKANLKKRGLSEAEILLRGYKSMVKAGQSKVAKNLAAEFGPDVVRKVPGIFKARPIEVDKSPYWALSAMAGILVPMRDIVGRITALKIRVDKPGDGPKYPYITSAKRKYAVSDGPGPEPGVHFPAVAEAAINANYLCGFKAVRLTEGELKADIATALSGIFTISLPGVSVWRQALLVLRQMNPETIYLAFDADCRDNYNVARALQNTAVALLTEGFNIILETWPIERGKGIDDLLAAGYAPEQISGREQVTAAVNRIAAAALSIQSEHLKQKEQLAKLSGPVDRIPVNADFQDLVYQKKACWNALSQQSPPLVFSRSGSLVRIKHTVDEGYLIDVLRVDSLRNSIADITRWYKTDKHGTERSTFPVVDTIKGMLSESSPPVPRLRRIVQAPVFAAGGTLITEPGYHKQAQTWHDKTCDIPAVPSQPTPTDIAKAKSLFLDDLFVDFPFTCESDKAYAIAATLLPFCRQLISGPTPLHLIDAKSGAGTGKSLLADMITIPAAGQAVPGMTEARDDDEWRKRITAKLITGSTFFLIDNINRKLDSGGLSAAITLGMWEDRMLGESRSITLPIDCVWLATGNSVRTSREIARRLVKTKMDARMENPWARSEFKHKSLREWALTHRGELVWAALVLIQSWLAAGKPAGKAVFGTFEQWARVMGGILDVAGIPGFLTNLREMHSESDEETEAWHGFLAEWWSNCLDAVVSVKLLYDLAVENDLLLPILGGGTERSQKTVLGSALGRMVGRRLGEFEICEAPADRRQRTKQYRLKQIDLVHDDGGSSSYVNPGQGNRVIADDEVY